jgi:hypothetical protein
MDVGCTNHELVFLRDYVSVVNVAKYRFVYRFGEWDMGTMSRFGRGGDEVV